MHWSIIAAKGLLHHIKYGGKIFIVNSPVVLDSRVLFRITNCKVFLE